MRLDLFSCLLIGILSVAQVGCEQKTVVDDPDDDGSTVIERDTVIESPGVDADVDADDDAADSTSGVDVKVGGGEGIDVDVDRDANEAPANP